jgi:hypothetical protein
LFALLVINDVECCHPITFINKSKHMKTDKPKNESVVIAGRIPKSVHEKITKIAELSNRKLWNTVLCILEEAEEKKY